MIPINSQCPVVVSLPGDLSAILPQPEEQALVGGTPSMGTMLPSPSFSRLGRCSPPTALAVLGRVALPLSPYCAASGRSPTPTLSRTKTIIRGLSYLFIASTQLPKILGLGVLLSINV